MNWLLYYMPYMTNDGDLLSEWTVNAYTKLFWESVGKKQSQRNLLYIVGLHEFGPTWPICDICKIRHKPHGKHEWTISKLLKRHFKATQKALKSLLNNIVKGWEDE